jgi:hypothetical protein
MNAPVSIRETAGEGGECGNRIRCLLYAHNEENESLEAFLSNKVFAGGQSTTVAPDSGDVDAALQ